MAQLGATIGREFSYDLIRQVTTKDERTLEIGLAELVQSEFVYQRGAPPYSNYIFKHALIQDAAAGSLLRSRRLVYHRRIAEALERRVPARVKRLPWEPPTGQSQRPDSKFDVLLSERFPDAAEIRPERLAYHYTEAAAAEPAVDWWLRAALRAIEQSAHLEALRHVEQGLRILRTLTADPENRRREQALQAICAPALVATRGYADATVEKAYRRLQELCRSSDDRRELFLTSLGLWQFYVVRADFDQALALSRELTEWAELAGDPALLIEARFAVGCTRFFMGDFAGAWQALEGAAGLCSPERDVKLRIRSGQDAGVTSLVFLGMTAWALGRTAEALRHGEESVALALREKHPFSLVYALHFSSWIRLWAGDYLQAEALADEVIRRSREHGFFWVTLGMAARGRALAERDLAEEGLEQIREGLSAFLLPGARLSQTLQRAFEAEALLRLGRPADALQAARDGLAAAAETGEGFWTPELRRLEGEGLLGLGDDGAEVAFRRALESARRQSAPALELRAGRRLAELLAERGRGAEALETLEATCRQTAAADGCDADAARSLLERLRAPGSAD